MAKGIWIPADSPDDPIYDGRIVISSHNLKLPKEKPAEASPEEQYPDLQNLPVDPAEEFLKEIEG